MKYRKALEQIAESFVGISYDELTTAEKSALRTATVALGWFVETKNEDREIYLQKG